MSSKKRQMIGVALMAASVLAAILIQAFTGRVLDFHTVHVDVISPNAIATDSVIVFQRRLRLEFMDGLSYTTIIEPAEPFARRRGSALDR